MASRAWLAVTLPLWAACNPSLTIAVDQETIQAAVNKKFPVKKGSAGFVEVVLHEPRVSLPGKARVGIDMDVDVIVPDVREVELPEVKTEGTLGVMFQDGATWALEAAVAVTDAPRLTLSGALAASGKLDYEPVTKAFMLRQASVDRIAVDGMKPEHAEDVKTLATAAATLALDRYPLYVLDDGTAQKIASLVVKDVRAEEGAILMTFGK